MHVLSPRPSSHRVCLLQMDRDFRAELRQFFINRRSLHRSERETHLVSLLSPSLKQRAVLSQCQWLLRVPYLREANVLFIGKLQALLKGQVYPPHEIIQWEDALCQVSCGIVSRGGHIMTTGTFWGIDTILWNPALKKSGAVQYSHVCRSADTQTKRFLRNASPFS